MTTNRKALVETSALTSVTRVDGTDRQEFITRYLSAFKKAAGDIIELGAVVSDAQDELDELDFDHFCRQVNLDPKGSTVRKLAAIGKKADRLSPYTEILPTNWTTIYKCAQLPNPKFRLLAASDVFGPEMTAKQLDAFLGKEPKPSAKLSAAERQILIRLKGLDADQRAKLRTALDDLRETIPFQIEQ